MLPNNFHWKIYFMYRNSVCKYSTMLSTWLLLALEIMNVNPPSSVTQSSVPPCPPGSPQCQSVSGPVLLDGSSVPTEVSRRNPITLFKGAWKNSLPYFVLRLVPVYSFRPPSWSVFTGKREPVSHRPASTGQMLRVTKIQKHTPCSHHIPA